MLRNLRAKLSYANVMSTLAVFMLLGGSAYAATKLPKNSVGANQIKSGAVRSSEVKDGSLLKKDFKAGQLPAGPQGAKGDRGDAGARGDTGSAGERGPSDVYTAYRDNVGVDGTLTLDVPAGAYSVVTKQLLHNGSSGSTTAECELSPSDGFTDYIVASMPAGAFTALTNAATRTFTAPGTFTLTCTGVSQVYKMRIIATRTGAVH